MIKYGNQKMFVEFKSARELLGDLPNAVNELKENWRSISIGMMFVSMSHPLFEFMSEAKPFLFYKDFKSFNRSVIRIEHQHSKGGKLCGSIPTVGAMD